MQASEEIRQKLILVLGQLISRCIEEARKVPFILDQEQVVEILVKDPAVYAKLVRDEQQERTEFSSDRLTARLDAISELAQFNALDALGVSFSSRIETDAELDAVMEQINQLTRTFVVYVGNLITIFEKEFQLFMEKFRQSLQQTGMSLKTTEFTPSDMKLLEEKAKTHLAAGEFLQAFSFDRLLNCQVITKELVSLPVSGYSFQWNLIKSVVGDAGLFSTLVKFIFRACYISQGSWQDLFVTLTRIMDQEPERYGGAFLIDRIEQDGVFCCNLLCEPYANLKKWPSARRREAIERKLNSWRNQYGVA